MSETDTLLQSVNVLLWKIYLGRKLRRLFALRRIRRRDDALPLAHPISFLRFRLELLAEPFEILRSSL